MTETVKFAANFSESITKDLAAKVLKTISLF